MENLRKYRIAVVQMDSRNDKGANVKYACQCIDEAAANGAKLISFPELYRIMTLEGAQVIFTPASFTMATGKEHWERILRTRAIENACYIVAADQIGQKHEFLAYGHSMVIDPWGTIIAKARDEAGMFYADIDLDYEDKIRQKVPVLKNRRADIYEVKRR